MRSLAAAIVLLACACSSDIADPRSEESLDIRTGRESYTVAQAVDVTVTNRAGLTVYVSHCDYRLSLVLEERTSEGWQPVQGFNGPCIAILPMGELGIGPGATRAESIAIDRPGEFRLTIYGRLASDDFGSEVATSNSFTVR